MLLVAQTGLGLKLYSEDESPIIYALGKTLKSCYTITGFI